jgi:hypothetical protein
MTAKLTAKQAQDFITLVKNAEFMLFRGRESEDWYIGGQVNAVAGKPGSGYWWQLNRATAKKLMALGMIERGTRRPGTWEYMIVVTNAGHEELGRHYDLSKPQPMAAPVAPQAPVAPVAEPVAKAPQQTTYISKSDMAHLHNCSVVTRMIAPIGSWTSYRTVTREAGLAGIASGKYRACAACAKVEAKLAPVATEAAAEPVTQEPAVEQPVAPLTNEQKHALAVAAMRRLADMVEFQDELLKGTGLENLDSRAIAKQLATWVNWMPVREVWDTRLGE